MPPKGLLHQSPLRTPRSLVAQPGSHDDDDDHEAEAAPGLLQPNLYLCNCQDRQQQSPPPPPPRRTTAKSTTTRQVPPTSFFFFFFFFPIVLLPQCESCQRLPPLQMWSTGRRNVREAQGRHLEAPRRVVAREVGRHRSQEHGQVVSGISISPRIMQLSS